MTGRAELMFGLTFFVGAAVVAVVVDPAASVTGLGLAMLGLSLVSQRFPLLLRCGLTLFVIGMAMTFIADPGSWGWAANPWFWTVVGTLALIWAVPIRIRAKPHLEDPL